MTCSIVLRRACLLGLLLFQFASSSSAHTMAPVLTTITQQTESDYKVLWSFSRNQGAIDPRSLSIQFTPECSMSGSTLTSVEDNRWLREEHYQCELNESKPHSVEIEGLRSIERSVVLRIVDKKNAEQIHFINEYSEPLALVPEKASQKGVYQYLVMGVEHILGGADHLLFVLAICFLAGGVLRTLIGLITAFTIAHSITLSAAALGWVHIPSRPVESLIAFSIALLAVDLVKNKDISLIRIVDYWPIVFIFGLFHGLGFAGAILEIGLPQDTFLLALLTFNLGVEIGQLCIVAVCVFLIHILNKMKEPGWFNPAVGLGVGCTAGFWFVSLIF